MKIMAIRTWAAVMMLLVSATVLAHGDPVPQRGGILQVLDELDFELVVIDGTQSIETVDAAVDAVLADRLGWTP